MEGHDERADELDREAKRIGQASDELQGDIKEAKSDWESKKGDSQVPGALEEGQAGDPEGETAATGEGEPEEENAAGEDGGPA